MNNNDRIIGLRNLIKEKLYPLINADYVLLDIPNHNNIGDNLIWEGELMFLNQIKSYKLKYSANYNNTDFSKISPHDIILLHGGGNFGDLYREFQLFRLKVIQMFPNNRIVIFPQTVYYCNQSLLIEDAKIINSHQNIFICTRDNNSYQFIQPYIDKEKLILLPDMAFMVDLPCNKICNGKKLVLARTDSEKLINLPTRDIDADVSDWPSFSRYYIIRVFYIKLLSLQNKLSSFFQRIPFLRSLVNPKYGFMGKHKREKYIREGIEFLRPYSEVYTTRLHGMIFSLLLDKKVYVIGDKYNKCVNFYNTWLRDFENVTLFNTTKKEKNCNMCSSAPLLSVIVPVYGVESYIERCAISLFEQTLDNIEFIFVDDKTKDKSIEILEKTLNKYPHRRELVKFIKHKENKGLAASRQDGFDIAQGEYIAHCDSDDWVERDMYERMLRKAVEDNADIVCCNYYEEYNKKQIKVEYDISEETHDDVMNSYPSTIYSAVWNKIIKRKLYIDNNIRWFKNINMQEDLGITTRLRILSTKTTILNLCLYHYNKQNISSISIAPKKSNIYEQIECARQLDLWIKEFAGENYYMLGNKIKFWAKCGLAIHPSTRDIDQWRSVFPETNAFAGEFKQMPFYIRWPLFLYAKGFVVIPNFLININTCVKSFFYRNR